MGLSWSSRRGTGLWSLVANDLAMIRGTIPEIGWAQVSDKLFIINLMHSLLRFAGKMALANTNVNSAQLMPQSEFPQRLCRSVRHLRFDCSSVAHGPATAEPDFRHSPREKSCYNPAHPHYSWNHGGMSGT